MSNGVPRFLVYEGKGRGEDSVRPYVVRLKKQSGEWMEDPVIEDVYIRDYADAPQEKIVEVSHIVHGRAGAKQAPFTTRRTREFSIGETADLDSVRIVDEPPEAVREV